MLMKWKLDSEKRGAERMFQSLEDMEDNVIRGFDAEEALKIGE